MDNMDKILAALDLLEKEEKKASAERGLTSGPLHEGPLNAANQTAHSSHLSHDLNAMAFASAASNTVAGSVERHQPREYAYDDREAKLVQGRMWLISFTDLFSIMLCFFLMLYSMKDPANIQAPNPTDVNARNMHGGSGRGEAGSQAGQNISRTSFGSGLDLGYLQGILKDAVAQVKLQDDVRITPARDHLRLVLDADKVFSGNALSADGQRITKGLANRLATLSNRITVVGIPDDAGDWDSALAQVSAFAALFRDAGYRKPFVVIAQGTGKQPGIEIRVDADDGNMQ